jgi:hypothetical protein
MVVIVTVLMIFARWKVRKKRHGNKLKMGHDLTPDDEADEIPPVAIYALALVAILQGIMFAVFSGLTAGNIGNRIGNHPFLNMETMLQTLRFSSILFLAMHRTIRPANRVDPMRTVMELEVVSVCWDALDGSTIYSLLDDQAEFLEKSMKTALRMLMVIW